MSSYLRPDDGIAQAAEMVEIHPGQFVNREVARQLGLAIDGVRGGRKEIRAEAPAVRASEVAEAAAIPVPSRPAVPPEVRPSPPAAPIAPPSAAVSKAKRSLKEILAERGR